mmetsp:Transcript_1890/g.3399  ORF Transcript_1890/g.3399 Transcript_1890/m.3399 type:complete len:364 (-) Transcript_1890:136-1227(-)
MSIQQSPQSLVNGRQNGSGSAHAGLKTRPSAAANRSPAVSVPTASRLQSNRAAVPPRKSPTRQIRNFRSVSSAATMKTPQGHSAQNALARQMQVLTVTSPIGKPHVRSASAGHFAPPNQSAKPPAGSFRRRPAHLQALEASRKKLGQDQAVAVMRAKDACTTLRSNLAALSFKLDFSVVDRFARSRGEEGLLALCQQLEQLNYLSQSFCRILLPYDQRAGAGASSKANSLRIKSFVVSLQAMADRLQAPATIDPACAERVAQIVDQGLLEQILSWLGEIESSYEALRPARALPAQPPLRLASSQHAGRCDVRRKLLTIGAKRSSPSSSPDSSTSTDKERMERNRPPQLLIPETSFERKTRVCQ